MTLNDAGLNAQVWLLECINMPKFYLIGGAPRIGKSTIMDRFIQQKPMQAVSNDAIREVLKGVLSKADNPDLFKLSLGPLNGKQDVRAMMEDPQSLIPHYIRHFDVIWKSVEDFVTCNMNNERDTIVEGTAILPANIVSLPYDHTAVFVVNLEDQTDSMLAHARANPHDWLNLYDEKTTRAFANFTQELNQYYCHQAQAHNIPMILVENNDFESSVNRAVDVLLGH